MAERMSDDELRRWVPDTTDTANGKFIEKLAREILVYRARIAELRTEAGRCNAANAAALLLDVAKRVETGESLYDGHPTTHVMFDKYLEELEQYRQHGTPEQVGQIVSELSAYRAAWPEYTKRVHGCETSGGAGLACRDT